MCLEPLLYPESMNHISGVTKKGKPSIDIHEHLFYNVIRRKPKLAAFR